MLQKLIDEWKERKIKRFIKFMEYVYKVNCEYTYNMGYYTIELCSIAERGIINYLSKQFIKELAKINADIFLGTVQTQLPNNKKVQIITIKGKI